MPRSGNKESRRLRLGVKRTNVPFLTGRSIQTCSRSRVGIFRCSAMIIPVASPQKAGHPMCDVTRILSAIEQGDPSAAEQLLPPRLPRVAEAGGPKDGPGGPGAYAPGHGPWSTRRTSGWLTSRKPSIGTVAATSFPPPPRPCNGFRSKTLVANDALSMALSTRGSTSTKTNREPPRRTIWCWPSTNRSTSSLSRMLRRRSW